MQVVRVVRERRDLEPVPVEHVAHRVRRRGARRRCATSRRSDGARRLPRASTRPRASRTPCPPPRRRPSRATAAAAPRSAVRASQGHLHPAAFAVRERDGVAEDVLDVAVAEGRVVGIGGRPAACDVRVHGAVQLAERVGEALRVRRPGGASAPPRRGASARGCAAATSFGSSRRPSQSSSWRSASQASAPAEPSTSNAERVLAARRDLGDDERRRARRSRSAARMCARSSVVIGDVLALDVAGRRERLDLADRPLPRRDHRREVGEDLDDAQPRHELGQVEPVRADVADRAQLARAGRARAASSSRSGARASPAGSRRGRSRPRRARPRGRARAHPGRSGRSGC